VSEANGGHERRHNGQEEPLRPSGKVEALKERTDRGLRFHSGGAAASGPITESRKEKTPMKRLFVFVAMVIFASFAVLGVAPEKEGKAASTGKKPSVYKAQVVTGTATVEAVDVEKRMVTLKRADGSVFDLEVGPEVRNLPQVKVGDEVVVKYIQAIAIQVTKPGPAEGSAVKETVARAKPGEKPAGMVAKQVTVTATVEKIDKKKMMATLKGPEGKVVDVKVRNPKNLENVNVGDQVIITYTEAVAVSVEKPKKK
jgi:hypothetical protein